MDIESRVSIAEAGGKLAFIRRTKKCYLEWGQPGEVASARFHFLVSNRYLCYWGSQEKCMCFDIQPQIFIGPFCPKKGKWLLFAYGNSLHKFLKNAGFQLIARNCPVAQVELISVDLDCLEDVTVTITSMLSRLLF